MDLQKGPHIFDGYSMADQKIPSSLTMFLFHHAVGDDVYWSSQDTYAWILFLSLSTWYKCEHAMGYLDITLSEENQTSLYMYIL